MKKFICFITASVVLTSTIVFAQGPNAPVVVKAVDSATPATPFNVGSTSDNSLRVHVVGSDVASGGTSAADGAAFAAGSTSGTAMQGARDDASPGTVAEDKLGIVRITTNRALHINLRNASGTEVGDATTPLQVSLANTGANATAVKVDGSAVTQPVSGTVTANAGTGTFGTNIAQANGATVDIGNGTAGTGTLRVAIASNNTAFSVNAAQSGVWTVQPGNTVNTSPWLVKAGPYDGCGTTTYDPTPALIATNTLDTLTSTTTCVDTIAVANVGSSEATITIQDVQGTPVQLLKVIPVAPGATVVLPPLGGLKFASGIKYQASAANQLSLWVKGRQ